MYVCIYVYVYIYIGFTRPAMLLCRPTRAAALGHIPALIYLVSLYLLFFLFLSILQMIQLTPYKLSFFSVDRYFHKAMSPGPLLLCRPKRTTVLGHIPALLCLAVSSYLSYFYVVLQLDRWISILLSEGGDSSCGHLWCCSCRVLCGVVLVVCLCV